MGNTVKVDGSLVASAEVDWFQWDGERGRMEAQSSAPCSLPSISSHWSLNSYTVVEDSYHFGLLHGLLFLFTLCHSYLFTRAAITKFHKLSRSMQQKVILSQTLMLMSDSRCRWGCDSSGASFTCWVTSLAMCHDSQLQSLSVVPWQPRQCPCVSLPSMIRTPVVGLKPHPKSE